MLWSKALESGIPIIDAQHQELFRQVDILIDGKNANRHKEVLDYLEQYIAKHFSDEQKMHAESKYPKAAEHKRYHDEYVKVFKRLKDKYIMEGPTPANNMEINKSVVGWLKDHIMVRDKEFAVYYKGLK
jgi:hemerythrin